MGAGCLRHTCSGEGWRGCGVEKMVRRYHYCTVSSCRGCKGQRQCQVVEKFTPHMFREGEEGWTASSICKLWRPWWLEVKTRTWRKYMRTPQDSEGVTTVQINAKSFQGEPPFLVTITWIIIWAEHWLGPSPAVILIRGNRAGMNWFIYNNRWKRRRFLPRRYGVYSLSEESRKLILRTLQPKANPTQEN